MEKQDGSAVDREHTEPLEEAPAAQDKEIAPKGFFERLKEAVSRVLGSIKNGLRRAFCWVKDKFSPKGDDTDV